MSYNYRNLLVSPFIFGLLLLLIISACGGGTVVTPVSSNTKLAIVNTSPDVGPVGLYVNNIQLGVNTGVLSSHTFFRYSTIPTYYSIGTGTLTLALRTDHNVNAGNSRIDTVSSNTSYSLFLMGLATVDSLSTLFITDTTKIPALGRGKIRFINASPRTPALDISANGTSAFTKIAFKAVSKWVELPAGTYDFKVTANGAPANILTDLPRVTIQDGSLYNLYTKGLAGHTDTASLSLNVITIK